MVVVVTMEFFDKEQGMFFVDLSCLPKMPGKVCPPPPDLKLTEEIFGRAWWGVHGIWHPWTASALFPFVFFAVTLRLYLLWGLAFGGNDLPHRRGDILWSRVCTESCVSTRALRQCFVALFSLHFNFWMSSLLATFVHYLSLQGQNISLGKKTGMEKRKPSVVANWDCNFFLLCSSLCAACRCIQPCELKNNCPHFID